MTSISLLRKIVNNGWTIANRRTLCSRIGKENFSNLIKRIKDPDPLKLHPEENLDRFKKLEELSYDTVQNYCPSPAFFAHICSYDWYKIRYLADATKPIKQVLQETSQYFTPIEKYWGRKINVGRGNWNSEKYGEFKHLDTWMLNRKIASGEIPQNSELVKARKAIFKDLKPLGCDEIHYRGEIYRPEEKHFDYLRTLKKGDIYQPKTNLWITNDPHYAEYNYGRPARQDWNGVVYEILCPEEAKIIQKPYSWYHGKPFTEGIYPDDAKFKIIESKMDNNILRLRMEYIVN